MIVAIVLIGTALVVAVAITAIISPAKLAVGLFGTGMVVFAAFIGFAITSSVDGSEPMGGFSHAQLESDRVMTQQMATVVGPGMEAQMTTNGMLQRSTNSAYLQALEQHTYQVDRMLGRMP